jgi:hypothetical protein
LNLYKYQLDAISWMKSIEDDEEIGLFNKPWQTSDEISSNFLTGFDYVPLIPWRRAKSSVLFDLVSYPNKFVTVKDIPEYTFQAKPKGTRQPNCESRVALQWCCMLQVVY